MTITLGVCIFAIFVLDISLGNGNRHTCEHASRTEPRFSVSFSILISEEILR